VPGPYDAIIVGGGHNGLVCAAYLARAGRRILVLEARELVGGCAVTEEIWPGYHVSTASYLSSLLQERVVRDLELERFGYHVDAKDPAFFSPFPDGRHLFMWQDRARTLAEIAKVKVFTQSAADFLDTWFESEELKVTLATDGVIGANGGPRSPGTAYILLHHCMGGVGGVRGLWGFVRGGMGAVSEAMAASARSRGAEIRVKAPVEKIVVRDGHASGVVLKMSGEQIDARIVVSNLDPKKTFLELIGEADLPETFLDGIRKFRIEGTSLKMNLALSGLPEFRALPSSGPQEKAPQYKATMHICPSIEYIERAWDDAKYGRPSRSPLIEMTIPTMYDPSLAPVGRHIMGIFLQYAPYTLKNRNWDAEREPYTERVLDVMEEYCPNIRSIIVERQTLTPLDLERRFGITGGNIFHGEMSLDQMFVMRPLAGWARYRTPIPGLYLCGSGAHPGGGVMGAPGHNAAREILKDR